MENLKDKTKKGEMGIILVCGVGIISSSLVFILALTGVIL